jgi:hypothetical protein
MAERSLQLLDDQTRRALEVVCEVVVSDVRASGFAGRLTSFQYVLTHAFPEVEFRTDDVVMHVTRFHLDAIAGDTESQRCVDMVGRFPRFLQLRVGDLYLTDRLFEDHCVRGLCDVFRRLAAVDEAANTQLLGDLMVSSFATVLEVITHEASGGDDVLITAMHEASAYGLEFDLAWCDANVALSEDFVFITQAGIVDWGSEVVRIEHLLARFENLELLCMMRHFALLPALLDERFFATHFAPTDPVNFDRMSLIWDVEISNFEVADRGVRYFNWVEDVARAYRDSLPER